MASHSELGGSESRTLTTEAQEMLDTLNEKLMAFQEREVELRKALTTLGYEWLLDMEGLKPPPNEHTFQSLQEK
ncbi:hypothetical protein CFAM422_004968 [Trichoderma lentiforme]|uniref:Uncharacterized protein n=1 Tax=Trichoderma lentiforme TaxID=1567552 RepID=A0A9P4XFQ8_9HYPO|nr:hypothetical protein CFAM422_004968 [Trichoderma lentiforme]